LARILVIDDDQPFLKIVQTMLERAGHQVVTATNGAEGVREFKRGDFSLVLCDLLIPGGDGLHTLKALHTISPDLPVIMTSGATPRAVGPATEEVVNYLEKSELLGATSTLTKPFRAEQLMARIDQALGRSPSA
jgi:CheY-like chemotaxis protein